MALLECTGLERTFGGLRAIGGVDITVDRGEVLGLIGPNGAGKTTLVNLLTGEIAPSAGTILYNGADITRLAPFERSRLGISRTFQVPRPFASMSIRDNVKVGSLFGRSGRSLSRAAIAERIDQVLEMTRLANHADSSPTTLSTAGLKRLEVARCLATDPELLLLDEPLGGLNAVETQEALSLIAGLSRSGVTIIFIEHIIKAVTAVSHRIVVVVQGLKLAEGTPKEIVANEEVRRAYLGDVAGAVKRNVRPGSRRSGAPTAGSSSCMMENPLLQIEGLHSGYGQVPVLRDVSFSVWPNEIVAILGSNGAGKSTLIRTISGLLQPTRGTITFDGRSTNNLDPSQNVRLGIAQAPEGRRMFTGLTVEDNLRLGAFARKDKTASQLQHDVEAMFDYFPQLRERKDQLAGTLSGGEQQMCAIGRALMAKPKLLMIDELSLGLAPIIVEDLIDILSRIHAAGTTILLVEQDAGVALGFADRAIVLETGRISHAGSAKEMLERSDIVKSYLGEGD